MSISKTELLKEIELMPIFQKDYDIIVKILDNAPPSLFSIIMENVLNGELYLEDFEEILTNTNYHDILKRVLESQEETYNNSGKFDAYRMSWTNDNSSEINRIALNNEFNAELYNSITNSVRKNLIYEILKIDKDDSDIAIMCKLRLYEYVLNGLSELESDRYIRVYEKIKKGVDYYIKEFDSGLKKDVFRKMTILDEESQISDYYIPNKDSEPDQLYVSAESFVQGEDYYTREGSIYNKVYIQIVGNSTNTGSYYRDVDSKPSLSINDIFFFLNTYIIPVKDELQTLDGYDLDFMSEHNISEEQMKHLKALYVIGRGGLNEQYSE